MIKKCNLLLYKVRDQKLLTQYGGKEGDEKIISRYLNNNEYNHIRAYCETDIYDFKVSDKNTNNIENSRILGNGLSSTVVIIEPITFPYPYLLVLKILFVKNESIESQTYWNYRFYNDMYITIKNLVNNFLGTCLLYGDNIKKFIKVDQFEDTLSIIEGNHLAFSIYKYYKKEITNISKSILKLTTVLFYISYNLRRYMTDIKYDNISFDEKENIVVIDYDTETFNKYYKDGYNIFWKRISIRSHSPCYIKKKFYLLLNLGSDETAKDIESETHKFKTNISYTIKIDIIISRLIEQKSGVIDKISVSNNNYYYTSNFNPNFENFNIYSLTEILLKLFFNVNLLDLLYKTGLSDDFKLNKLNTFNLPNDRNIIDKLSCFQNLNDIKILTKYVYEFIQPKPEFNPEYIIKLKYLLFDPISEFGLLGCDFENTPYLGLIFKYLFSLYNPNPELNLYQVFKLMLDENIGTEQVLSKTDFQTDLQQHFKIINVGSDVLGELIKLGLLQQSFPRHKQPFIQTEYNIVAFARLVEQLMDRPDNRSDTNLEIPPENSTLPQNYCKFMNKETCEIISVKKWIKNPRGIYIDNPELIRIKSDTNFESYISYEQKQLDEYPLRILANIIVSKLKKLPIIIPETLSELLSEPYKTALLRLQDIYKNKYIKYKNKYLKIKLLLAKK